MEKCPSMDKLGKVTKVESNEFERPDKNIKSQKPEMV